jgi:hypothetical protein
LDLSPALVLAAVSRASRPGGPGAQHWPIRCRLLEATGTAGNLTSDTHVEGLALERGATVCSTDYELCPFPRHPARQSLTS